MKKMGESVAYHRLLLLWILVSGVGLCATKELTIAAFNVQIFGQKKSENAFVMDILVKTILRYDIVLIQEIRDSKETAILKLLDQVNAATPSNQFDMRISSRLGRSSSKEQYAFFYRPKSSLRVEQVYTYDDGDESLNNKALNITVDTFQREPFILRFSSTTTAVKEFALAGVHIAPEEAVEEIKALKEVFLDIQEKMGVTDIMIMGDLNADCSYVSKTKWKEILLKFDSSYHWLIDGSVDTTVSNTDCAYDRFIGKGNGFSPEATGGVVAGSAKVFNYKEEYPMSLEQALDVSDHYPIEFKLKDKDGAANSHGTTGRLRSTQILNVYVAVPGKSLSEDREYYINDISLKVQTVGGATVGTLNDVTKKDKDIRMAIVTVLKDGLNKEKIRVQMVRPRKYRRKQLCKIIIKFDNSVHQRVEHVFAQTLKGYGNVIFI